MRVVVGAVVVLKLSVVEVLMNVLVVVGVVVVVPAAEQNIKLYLKIAMHCRPWLQPLKLMLFLSIVSSLNSPLTSLIS